MILFANDFSIGIQKALLEPPIAAAILATSSKHTQMTLPTTSILAKSNTIQFGLPS